MAQTDLATQNSFILLDRKYAQDSWAYFLFNYFKLLKSFWYGKPYNKFIFKLEQIGIDASIAGRITTVFF